MEIHRTLLPPFQIIVHFGKLRYIIFAMYVDTIYIQMHNKIYVSRFSKNGLQFGTEGLYTFSEYSITNDCFFLHYIISHSFSYLFN
jgi:hypothetical protein